MLCLPPSVYMTDKQLTLGERTQILKHTLFGYSIAKNLNFPLSIQLNIADYSSVEIAAELILSGAEEVETEFSYFQDALTARNINVRFDDGQTPLHLSSINGHVAITKYLLLNGANTQSQDSSGATPLHEAIRYGHLDIAKMLIDAGANVNAKDNLGKTPILLIIPQDKIEETYNLLIKNGADLNAKDMYGDTILHTAAMLKVNVSILENLTSFLILRTARYSMILFFTSSRPK